MRVFLTGATGFIGLAVAAELAAHGHEVTGLARSAKAAEQLEAHGYGVHFGELSAHWALRTGAELADGVIHTAFSNLSETTTITESTRADRGAVAAMGEALAGTGKPFVVTSVTSLLRPETTGTEEDEPWLEGSNPRAQAEIDALTLAERGIRVTAVRLPPSVHGIGDKGWVPQLIRIAKRRGIAGYIGDGSNRWPAVHRMDAARLFRLALESGQEGARFHAVAEEGIPMRDLQAAIGRITGLPTGQIPLENTEAHFGFLSRFVVMDSICSSSLTRQALGWTPSRPSLLKDLGSGRYAHETSSA